jgi:hypothetical protein
MKQIILVSSVNFSQSPYRSITALVGDYNRFASDFLVSNHWDTENLLKEKVMSDVPLLVIHGEADEVGSVFN